ncbi:hypothetical protein RRG08_033980 [Elysia crispata]|uniref:Uncharacterized protein n=1 Tax=Elysia crispata TaxID=231223 RepID=A0AAE0YTJ7_9GAST|nr:hypothetical protein RRG08_033980 [Elysia crispata]
MAATRKRESACAEGDPADIVYVTRTAASAGSSSDDIQNTYRDCPQEDQYSTKYSEYKNGKEIQSSKDLEQYGYDRDGREGETQVVTEYRSEMGVGQLVEQWTLLDCPPRDMEEQGWLQPESIMTQSARNKGLLHQIRTRASPADDRIMLPYAYLKKSSFRFLMDKAKLSSQ